MAKIKILIVDDHAVMREGVRVLLDASDEIEIVGEAFNGKDSIRKTLELIPDVILMDYLMPGMDGLEATRRILKVMPTAKVLFLTQYETKEHVLSAVKAGASGYISKRALGTELLKAIIMVKQGGCYFYPLALTALFDGYRQSHGPGFHDLLSGKERAILKLVAEGHTSRNISNMLDISLRTVHGHRMSIMKRLGIHNHSELIKYAIHHGFVSVNS